MINIAIVEDDKKYSETLQRYIMRYDQESGTRFNLSVFEDGEDVVTDYKANYDIILMDIEMTFLNGMEAAERIRMVDKDVIIIFITNMPQYAIKGYAVDALDYVLKPINYFAFSQRIDRALTRLRRREKKFISINVKGGKVKIDEDTIYYIESNNHNLIFHTSAGEYTSRMTLREMIEILDDKRFFQCNKCYLINLEYVTSCQESEVIVSKDTLQVSRLRKKALMDALNDYINEVSK